VAEDGPADEQRPQSQGLGNTYVQAKLWIYVQALVVLVEAAMDANQMIWGSRTRAGSEGHSQDVSMNSGLSSNRAAKRPVKIGSIDAADIGFMA
jgi:hypothetical protein